MLNKLTTYRQILKNMGWRYVRFRIGYEIKRKTGLLKRDFPTQPISKEFIKLSAWRAQTPVFFFEDKSALSFPTSLNDALKDTFQKFQEGTLKYFNSRDYTIGKDYDWLTNPTNQYRYDVDKHWTEIEDFSQAAGDIKYIWEKSRFSYLYDLIRYDYHCQKDLSELIFQEIESWITSNPVNQGPNWRCSQEMSLRILNWTFALYYYKNSEALTAERFQKIMHVIYWQLKHVAANINFSRIAVRNNHAITETLMLYLSGLLFPFFPEAAAWKKQGKKWFEEEIAYQIYTDGTFLQFSHNYHRVVIQLLTWAFYLAEKHGERFSQIVYDRAKKSLDYLYQCVDLTNGYLPNYGNNDGALFFRLNNQPYRDYRPQLNALYYFFNHKPLFDGTGLLEDVAWYHPTTVASQPFELERKALATFEGGGYYIAKTTETLIFLKCGRYKDRPAHADNLHLDIWWKGINILRDAGTYKYNTTSDLVRYFNGTSSHNTVTLGDNDQMQKGPRFVWFDWSQAIEAKVKETEESYLITGKIHAFKHIDKDINHTRQVKQSKKEVSWEITDRVEHQTELPIKQYWNIYPEFLTHFSIFARDEQGQLIEPSWQDAYYSSHYGVKEKSQAIVFSTLTKTITTQITRK
jgi:hypothetical protein